MKRLPSLAQHFLRSPRLVKELIGHTNIRKTDVVYDFGAGSGVVSVALAARAAQVVAVEIDQRMVTKLQQNLQALANVTIRHADVMTVPLPDTPYKVFANIPFHLSAAIVKRLCEAPLPPSAAYLIVQEQFARKLLPDNKGYTNQLALVVGVSFAARIRRRLQPGDFYPRPNVPTVLLELLHRPEPLIADNDLAAFRQLVTTSFTDPRQFWQLPLARIGMDAKASPSSLTLAQWLSLFQAMRG